MVVVELVIVLVLVDEDVTVLELADEDVALEHAEYVTLMLGAYVLVVNAPVEVGNDPYVYC